MNLCNVNETDTPAYKTCILACLFEKNGMDKKGETRYEGGGSIGREKHNRNAEAFLNSQNYDRYIK